MTMVGRLLDDNPPIKLPDVRPSRPVDTPTMVAELSDCFSQDVGKTGPE